MLLEEEGMEVQPALGIQRRANVHEFPLSFAQQRLWFLDQFEPGNHYNDCFNLRFKGRLDVAALGASVDEIARRHEAMRACFKTEHGAP